ncbi:thiol:disulfide interchange protein DsbA/DsbL [Aliikangiella coralliicola]|uniref:Thiol:disulfide interchange protein n=1 Tax=Aliikangiella coralliicola TaxID=2592383 RepID=A0A545UGM3_9GAMM|nr:thiol:disulfide interchange protein DsbA/DsbL [Aliikangiella coralliicola]TQV88621.1 thiol:disulfide interchange protein DsbA/DsbL [Aliikangiella coralliicola]
MKKLKKLFAIGVAVIASASWNVAANSFEAGKDYEIVGPQIQTEPVVEEFFNYACGACYGAEQFATNLKKNNPGLKFRAVPVELRPAWKIYVKAYFIGEKLGVLEKSHGKIFHRLHVEKKFFKGEDDMKEFFLSLGVESDAYDKVAKSYWLKTQMRLAKQYSFKNKVASTPVFLVNKRYKLNSAGLGSYQRMEEAVKELSGLNKSQAPAQ